MAYKSGFGFSILAILAVMAILAILAMFPFWQ